VNPSTRIPQRRRAIALLAAVASFSLVAAACGDDNTGSSAAAGAAVTTPVTNAAPAAAPVTDAVSTTPAAMAALEPTGPGCAAVPADGAGSFAGMAQDPAATAASNNPALATLVAAVTAAGLADTLNGEGSFTIFAPTNDAFAKIPADQLQKILADKDMLTSILTFHVVAGEKMSSADLVKAGTVATVNGAKLTITDVGGTLMVNGAKSVCVDVPTANATVHIIDTVLTP
jgi:uncharacterized surface protein with fasciclin (FAS1) repeats